jgi:hypothetical protein
MFSKSVTLGTLKHVTAESLVTEPNACENEVATKNFKGYKSPDTVQMPADLIQSGSRRLRPEMRKIVIIFAIGKNFLNNGRNLLLYRYIRRFVVIIKL